MSSPSTADPRASGRDREAIGILRTGALIALCAFAGFAQLDAVGNRLSAGSPISFTELTLAAVAGLSALLLLSRTEGAATGTTGIRLIFLLLLWAVFCWTLSRYRGDGLDYLIGFATAVGPALCVLIVVDRAWQLRAIVWAMIAAGVVAAAIVLVETKTGTRLFSTALAATTADFEGVARSSGGSDQNPTTAAQMLMTSTALALGMLFASGPARRWILAGAITIGAVALALMSARSAILGLGAAAALALFSLRGHRHFPLVVLATIAAGVVALFFAPPTLIERFAAIGDFGKDQTLFRRITYLRIGADLIAQSPVWGIGPGNYPHYFLDDAYRYLPGRVLIPRELHNTYLDVATEFGLVGFAIFACLIGHALHAARRGFAKGASVALAQPSFAIAIGLTTLLVACFFMPHKDMRYLWLMLALAIQCGRLRNREDCA